MALYGHPRLFLCFLLRPGEQGIPFFSDIPASNNMRCLFPQYDQLILGEVRQVYLLVIFAQPENILDAAPQLSGLINAPPARWPR